MADNKAQAVELKNQGNKAFSAGDLPRAIELFTQAIALDASNHVFYSNRSAAHASSGQYAAALDDADATIRVKPDWPKGYGRRGAALSFLARHEEAREAYAKALELDPENAGFRDGLMQATRAAQQQAQEQGIPMDAIAGMFADEAFWALARTDDATKAFFADPSFVAMCESLQRDPATVQQYTSDQRLMQLIVLGLSNNFGGFTMPQRNAMPTQPRGAPQAASTSAAAPEPAPMPAPEPVPEPTPEPTPEPELSAEDKAAAANKEKALEEKAAGNAAYKKRDFATAMARYEAARTLDPTNMVFLNNMAAVHFEKKDYAACLAACEDAVALGKEQMADFKLIAKSYARMGSAHERLGAPEKAVEFYKRSLAEHRTAPTLNKLRALERAMKKAAEEAYWSEEKAAEAKARGDGAFREQRFPDAIREYTEAIKRNPRDHKVHSNRAAAYQKLGELPTALKDVERCIELEPTFVKAYLRKAGIHLMMKEFHKAKDAYDAGLAVDPNNVDLNQGKAQVVMRINAGLGQNDEERRQRAMADPEIVAILQDPVMQGVLQDMGTNPRAAMEHMQNPVVREKIEKLVAAGVVQMGQR